MATDTAQVVRGRFAPSPTGPLHFGSLVAALASALEAQARGGEWLVRIEDLDPPREVAGASDEILYALGRFGFSWPEPVLYQSQRTAAYEAAQLRLRDLGLAFWCGCSRREVGKGGHGRYPGTCREGLPPGRRPRALRARVPDREILVEDQVQGPVSENLAAVSGDFIVRRADRLCAYQLAVVVDDSAQQITDVVRGADLLDSTPRQCWLQQELGFLPFRYAHVPVVTTAQGEKLAKGSGATALDPSRAGEWLARGLAFLGQSPPADLAGRPLPSIWDWARSNWSLERVPRERAIPWSP